MIYDEHMAAKVENALAIIENAFEDAVDNSDCSNLEDEIKRGVAEIMACYDELMVKYYRP